MKPDYTVPLLLVFVALMCVASAIRDLKDKPVAVPAVEVEAEVIGPVYKTKAQVWCEETLPLIVAPVVGFGLVVFGVSQLVLIFNE